MKIFEGTTVQIIVKVRQHLRASTGSKEYRQQYVLETV